jgi:protein-L-isoaspartate(D-aspartate) O-methyltransferase
MTEPEMTEPEMTEMSLRRRFFAEEIEAICKIQSPALVDAFAAVPRERFLPPGPWTVLAESPVGPSLPGTRTTPDADPARVCHNIAVAIDPARALFNGQPGTLAVWIDALGLTRGERVLHIGCGLGYFTAILAECVGSTGRVVAYEVDEALAAGASENLADTGWVEVRHADASEPLLASETFDAILVNAGVTHPLDHWLDALAPGGRMILPLTSAMPAMGATIGKGLVFLITNDAGPSLAARVLTFVAIYSAVGIRDDATSERLGKAMMAGPAQWQGVKRLRRDPHEPAPACWFHAPAWCLSTA